MAIVQAKQAIGFFAAMHEIYASVKTIASVVTHTAKAAENLSIWAEEQTDTFVDEARVERQIKIDQLELRRQEILASKKSLTVDTTAKEVKSPKGKNAELVPA